MYANDTSGNKSWAEVYFTVIDATPPTWSNLKAPDVVVGDLINITIDVTDNVAIDQVIITIFNMNFSMLKSGDTYYYSWAHTEREVCNFVIYMNDSSGNMNITNASFWINYPQGTEVVITGQNKI